MIFIFENLAAAGVIGSYVTISIIGITLLSYISNKKMKPSMRVSKKWHPIIGGMLGLVPGCGATIFVSMMYKKNQISFGGLFAAFVVTLGEGSFVLLGASNELEIATNLRAFLIVSIIGLIVGIFIGYLLDVLGVRNTHHMSMDDVSCDLRNPSSNSRVNQWIESFGMYVILGFAAILLPSSLVALWGGRIHFIDGIIHVLHTVFASISMIYFLVFKYTYKGLCCDQNVSDIKSSLMTAIYDVTMIITYVFMSLLLLNVFIEGIVGASQFDQWLSSNVMVVVFIATLIGVLPGCGGMIAVTAAFVSLPSFPIAALIAAGIATSGDGIFPLFVSNKKDALIVMLLGFAVAVLTGFIVVIFS